MKFVKIVVVILVLLIVGILAVGVFSKEFQYSNQIEIRKPVSTVWKVFSDEARMKEWMEGLQSVECVKGEPLTVGSQWKLTFLERGKTIELFETVTAVVPEQRFAFDMETDPFTGSTDVTFHEHDGVTHMEVLSTVAGRNVLWRSILRLSSGMMRSQAQGYYERLKEVIEKSS